MFIFFQKSTFFRFFMEMFFPSLNDLWLFMSKTTPTCDVGDKNGLVCHQKIFNVIFGKS